MPNTELTSIFSSFAFGLTAPNTSAWLLGVGLAVVTSAGTRGLAAILLDLRAVLGRSVDLEVEVDLRAKAERHRVHRLQVGRIPVVALANRLQRRLGGADEAHYLRILQFGMVAQQPENGVGPVLPARQRRIARAALLLELGQAHLGGGERQAMARVLLGFGDLLAGELARGDRVVALDAGRHFAVGDAFDLEGVQFAELGDLIERQRGVFDQPDGRRFGHQRRFAHDLLKLLSGEERAAPAGGPGEAEPRMS